MAAILLASSYIDMFVGIAFRESVKSLPHETFVVLICTVMYIHCGTFACKDSPLCCGFNVVAFCSFH